MGDELVTAGRWDGLKVENVGSGRKRHRQWQRNTQPEVSHGAGRNERAGEVRRRHLRHTIEARVGQPWGHARVDARGMSRGVYAGEFG